MNRPRLDGLLSARQRCERCGRRRKRWSAANTYGYYQTGELKSVSQHTSGTSASYAYDGEGLRTKATETINTSTHESQTFTWDTETKTPELLADGSHYFIYGPTGQVIEQENETATLKGTLYLVHNALGSTVATITSTHVVSTVSYNAYGSVVGHTGNVNTTPIGFAGAYTDPVTGFLYLVHRYYDPTTGQFLSVDPDVKTTHQPYEYAGDDPVNNTDPSGDDCAGGPTTSAADAGAQLQQFAAWWELNERVAVTASAYVPFGDVGFLITADASVAIGSGSGDYISVSSSGEVDLTSTGASLSVSSSGLAGALLGTSHTGFSVSCDSEGYSATLTRSGSLGGNDYTLSVTAKLEPAKDAPPGTPGAAQATVVQASAAVAAAAESQPTAWELLGAALRTAVDGDGPVPVFG
jgi:RHS repeat-associated protein